MPRCSLDLCMQAKSQYDRPVPSETGGIHRDACLNMPKHPWTILNILFDLFVTLPSHCIHQEPKAVSLRQYLREIHQYGAYAGSIACWLPLLYITLGVWIEESQQQDHYWNMLWDLLGVGKDGELRAVSRTLQVYRLGTELSRHFVSCLVEVFLQTLHCMLMLMMRSALGKEFPWDQGLWPRSNIWKQKLIPRRQIDCCWHFPWLPQVSDMKVTKAGGTPREQPTVELPSAWTHSNHIFFCEHVDFSKIQRWLERVVLLPWRYFFLIRFQTTFLPAAEDPSKGGRRSDLV